MTKALQTPEQIKKAINLAMAKSDALDGDCRECQVRRICRDTAEEAKQLGRNWNVNMVNGKCRGDCMAVLEAATQQHHQHGQ
jgi:hypothetical protein